MTLIPFFVAMSFESFFTNLHLEAQIYFFRITKNTDGCFLLGPVLEDVYRETSTFCSHQLLSNVILLKRNENQWNCIVPGNARRICERWPDCSIDQGFSKHYQRDFSRRSSFGSTQSDTHV